GGRGSGVVKRYVEWFSYLRDLVFVRQNLLLAHVPAAIQNLGKLKIQKDSDYRLGWHDPCRLPHDPRKARRQPEGFCLGVYTRTASSRPLFTGIWLRRCSNRR